MNQEIDSSNDLLNQIADLKAQWDAAQPLSPENEHRLWQKLRLEWNYHSNHIEGNTLTYGETELLLIQGKTTGQHELREYEEMKAHDLGIEHVRSLASDERPITEADIRDLNRIILKEPFWKECQTSDGQPTRKQIVPGQYKTLPNNVRTATGEMFMFSSPEATQGEMAELTEWFRAGVEDINTELVSFLAAFHHRFSVIHPFDDGNGRTMRLLVNYALLRRGYVPLVVRTESKKEYLGALSAADAGDMMPFAQFIGGRIADALELGVRAAKGESVEEPEDWQKEMKLFAQSLSAETRPAPARSLATLRNWLTTTIPEITDMLLQKLGPISKLFYRVSWAALGMNPNQSEKIVGWNKDALDNLRQTGITALSLDPLLFRLWTKGDLDLVMALEGFSNPQVTPFDVTVRLRLVSGTFRYSIESDGLAKPVHNLRYDVRLPRKLLESLTSEMAKFIFGLVRSNTEQNTLTE